MIGKKNVIGSSISVNLVIFDTITKATNLVLGGAKLIGANSDVSGPVESAIAPATGVLIAPIEIATCKRACFCGKLNPLMMRTGLRLLDCRFADSVIARERMYKDIIAGTECGADTVLVLSGVGKILTLAHANDK